ncbi:NAC domain-containing protein 83-like [Argentina anserina]|uniref:NAC domain-containing protein 83-like n=1 Tax=Argentina anserina TaxID=57926 RepID=UPI00217634E3|nr:NAC domain-containing protein 83-like [Potentilla anserina]
MSTVTNIVPKGFRFHPKDRELVNDYLCSKVNGEESVDSTLIYKLPEVDVNAEEPWEIWENFGPEDDDESLYFFAVTKKLNPNGKRIDRRTKSGLGTWSEGERSKPINDVKGNPIGTKRKFRWESDRSVHHAAWQMEEYSSSFSPHWVICNLRKNKRSSEANKRNETSRSTRVKCTEPKKRRVEHQVVENTSVNMSGNNNDHLSAEMEYIMPNNNYDYYGEDLQQYSTDTTSCTNVATNLDFVAGHGHDNVIQINDAEGDDTNYWDNLLSSLLAD